MYLVHTQVTTYRIMLTLNVTQYLVNKCDRRNVEYEMDQLNKQRKNACSNVKIWRRPTEKVCQVKSKVLGQFLFVLRKKMTQALHVPFSISCSQTPFGKYVREILLALYSNCYDQVQNFWYITTSKHVVYCHHIYYKSSRHRREGTGRVSYTLSSKPFSGATIRYAVRQIPNQASTLRIIDIGTARFQSTIRFWEYNPICTVQAAGNKLFIDFREFLNDLWGITGNNCSL